MGDPNNAPLCLPLESMDTPDAGYRYPDIEDPQYAPPVAYLDLRGTDETVQLSANLQLSEFAAAHKGRWAVIQPHLVENLQAIRNELGPIVIESGYRSPQYNRSVGGAVLSRHQYGDAVDIWAMKTSLEAVKDACIRYGATYVEVYRGHVHCDWRDTQLDPGFYGEKYTDQSDQGGHSDDHSTSGNHANGHGHSHGQHPLSENEEEGGPIETFTF